MIFNCPCCEAKLKTCSECGILKLLADFPTQRANKCSGCHKRILAEKLRKKSTHHRDCQRKWRENPENREKARAYSKKYRSKPESKAKARRYSKAYYFKHKDLAGLKNETLLKGWAMKISQKKPKAYKAHFVSVVMVSAWCPRCNQQLALDMCLNIPADIGRIICSYCQNTIAIPTFQPKNTKAGNNC